MELEPNNFLGLKITYPIWLIQKAYAGFVAAPGDEVCTTVLGYLIFILTTIKGKGREGLVPNLKRPTGAVAPGRRTATMEKLGEFCFPPQLHTVILCVQVMAATLTF